MSDRRIFFVTAGNEDEAVKLAKTLVEERLAAGANIIPGLRSFYWWEGKVQDDPEYMIVIQSHAERADALIKRVQELHSYEVPEVISMKIEEGLAPYLNWIDENVVQKGN